MDSAIQLLNYWSLEIRIAGPSCHSQLGRPCQFHYPVDRDEFYPVDSDIYLLNNCWPIIFFFVVSKGRGGGEKFGLPLSKNSCVHLCQCGRVHWNVFSVSVSIAITELVYFLLGFEKFYPKSSKKTSDKGIRAFIPLGTTCIRDATYQICGFVVTRSWVTNTLHQLN